MDSQVERKWVLIVTTVGSFVTPFMASSVNIALPSIGKAFAMNAIVLSWVSTSYILAAAVFLVPFGRIADIYGRKIIFQYGVLIYFVSSFFLGMAISSGMLIAFRVLQGIGGAMTFGTGVAILTSVYPEGKRGRVLGINVASVYLGLSLGPVLGGWLTEEWGWRSIFLVNVPLGLVIFGLIIWKMRGEWRGARGEHFDFVGALIYSFTLVAVMYGFSLLPRLTGAGFICVGAASLWIFIYWESKVQSPVLDINLFRYSRVFAFSNLAALINYSATFAVGFLLSLYLQYVKGYGPWPAGMILVCQPAMQAAFSPFAGRLSDKTEPRYIASLGMGFTVIGLALLAFLSADTSLRFVISSLLFLGFGFALFSSPNTNAVMSAVEKKFYGVASGTLATMRLIGQMLSMGIAILLFNIFVGRVQITAVYYPLFLKSVRVAFSVCAVLCVIGILASLARGKVR